MPHALVVAQELGNLKQLQEVFSARGFSCAVSQTLSQARAEILQRLPDVALIRPVLPDGDGLVLLRDSRFANTTEIFLLSDSDREPGLFTALRVGSNEREARVLSAEDLAAMLIEVAQDVTMEMALDLGLPPSQTVDSFCGLRGNSPAMSKLYRLIRKVAPTPASVLLIGESGTGKELLAQSIHALSSRRDRPFIAVNCGAILKDLMESELFGHEKGSFTSASRQHRGIFERADGGSLFLDEITEMSVELQVKLLRVLESGCFTRVGGEQEIQTDIRIIAATNRDPIAAIRNGCLREDLYYRLAQFPVAIPPLRDRDGDVGLLAQYFVDQANANLGTVKVLGESALRRLREYDWPGNVRELKNVIDRAHILAEDVIQGEDLLLLAEGIEAEAASGYVKVRVGQPISEAEKALILATLEKNRGEKQKTADELGVSLKTLYNRLNEYEQRLER